MAQKLSFEDSTSNTCKCQANYNDQDSVIYLSLFDLDDPGNLVHFKKR